MIKFFLAKVIRPDDQYFYDLRCTAFVWITLYLYVLSSFYVLVSYTSIKSIFSSSILVNISILDVIQFPLQLMVPTLSLLGVSFFIVLGSLSSTRLVQVFSYQVLLSTLHYWLVFVHMSFLRVVSSLLYLYFRQFLFVLNSNRVYLQFFDPPTPLGLIIILAKPVMP